MTSQAVEVVTPQPVALPTDEGQAVFALMQQAIAQGGEAVAALERLVELQDRVARRRAELEFAAALADFQAHAPVVARSVNVSIATRSGTPIKFKSFSLDDLMDAVRQPLADRGMSVGFAVEVQGSTMIVKAILRHKNGAAPIESPFPITTNNPNPGMSEQHKWIGAQTFAKRYALVNVLGLTISDPDPESEGDPTPITNEQEATLVALVAETGVDMDKFKRFLGVTALAELRQTRYAEAVRALEAKRKGAAR